MRIVNRYNEIEKTPYNYGTDTRLHPSETHTIEFIGNNPNINVTKLAGLLGITKGAVSKRIQQLRKTGLVTKSVSPETENEVVLNLTDKGIQVYKAHAAYSKRLNRRIAALYADLPDEMIATLEEIGNETDKIFLEIATERKK
ncbi:MarR family transcriptional regulator [Agrilactobacillus composti DSM 18527 = JCM 14202]|uniref:MarR family transcriptional regulator n=1 Tax=Agrilactobacillus composti DSM 18527 = JCM 14202 TaxID=1423734 RepID=A0A0R1XVN7_9LACO|nr:MarR family transcriptional regulator [Agrilactobacillus composti DSM 18527 = JCM 14202]